MTNAIWRPFGDAGDKLTLSLGPLAGVIVVPDILLEMAFTDSSGYIYTIIFNAAYPEYRITPVWDSSQSGLTIVGRFNRQEDLDAAFQTVATEYAIDTEAIPDDGVLTVTLGNTSWVMHRPLIGMFGLIPETAGDSTLVALQYQYLFDYIEGGPSDPTRPSILEEISGDCG